MTPCYYCQYCGASLGTGGYCGCRSWGLPSVVSLPTYHSLSTCHECERLRTENEQLREMLAKQIVPRKFVRR